MSGPSVHASAGSQSIVSRDFTRELHQFTKVFRKVTNDTDKQSLQDVLDKLVKWSEKWQMLFNFGKCKCIHIGHGNMDEEYKMGDAVEPQKKRT